MGLLRIGESMSQFESTPASRVFNECALGWAVVLSGIRRLEKPGVFYQQVIPEETKEILKDLKAEDIANPRLDILVGPRPQRCRSSVYRVT